MKKRMCAIAGLTALLTLLLAIPSLSASAEVIASGTSGQIS